MFVKCVVSICVQYPANYLEALKEKQKQKENKTNKSIKKNNKRKGASSTDLEDHMSKSTKKVKIVPFKLDKELKTLIDSDEKNLKLWKQCEETLNDGKSAFVDKVKEIFHCVCCLDVVFEPVTIECCHSFCKVSCFINKINFRLVGRIFLKIKMIDACFYANYLNVETYKTEKCGVSIKALDALLLLSFHLVKDSEYLAKMFKV